MSVSERCKTHPDEIYTFYCGTHDMVYCPVCTEANHGECLHVAFLEDCPVVDKTEEESLLAKFSDIIEKVEKRKKPIEVEYNEYVAKRNEVLIELELFRAKVISQLDALIAKANDDVQVAFQDGEDVFTENLEKLSIIQTAVDCAKTRSNLTTEKTNEQALVDLKLGRYRLAAVEDMVNSLKLSDVVKTPPDLSIDEEAVKIGPGNIVKHSNSVNVHTDVGVTVESTSEVDIGLSDSLVSSDITGMCVLPDESILLCDHNNKHVKRMIDKKYVTSIPVPFNPFDACLISEREVVVSAPRQKQIAVLSLDNLERVVAVSAPRQKQIAVLSLDDLEREVAVSAPRQKQIAVLSLDDLEKEVAVSAPKQEQIAVLSLDNLGCVKTFQTETPCKGLASDGDHIFAASSDWTNNNSSGRIYQFNKCGEVIREFGLVWQSSVPLSPVRICLHRKYSSVIFTDPKHGVFRLSKDGKLKHLVSDMDISGVCVADNGLTMVCRVQSNTISAITEDGVLVSTVEIPNANWQVSMAMDNETSTLIVGSLNSKNVRLVEIQHSTDTSI